MNRSNRGQRLGYTRISSEDHNTVCLRQRAESGESKVSIAKDFEISRETVAQALRGASNT